MPVISICSPKGGVGKTTLTANLANIFSQAGTKVVAIDLDPQNSLRLYFGVPLSEDRGLITKIDEDGNWMDALMNVGQNLFLLPFGASNMAQRKCLDERLENPNYFQERQGSIFSNPDIIVIIDFPPGFSMALHTAANISDMHLVPLVADASSVSLFSQVQNDELAEGPLNHSLGYFIVLNKVDNRIKINREVQDFARNNFGDRLIGMIHSDTSVIEAAALQQPISNFNPNSSAGFDIEIIAQKVASILGMNVQQGTMVLNPLRNND